MLAMKNWSKVQLAAVGAVLASVAWGEVAYDAETAPGDLIVTVDEGSATLDAAQVLPGITNIVKRGVGDLHGTPLESYTGNFTIDQGCLVVNNRYDLGADEAGVVYVNDGASIRHVQTWGGWGDSLTKKKTFRFSGAPAAGTSGKICRYASDNSGSGQPWLGQNCLYAFANDSFIDLTAQRLKLHGTIDLGGHELDILFQTSSYYQIQMDCMITNGGHVVVRGKTASPAAYVMQNESGAFGFYPTDAPCSLTVTNAQYEARTTLNAGSATLNLHNGQFRSSPHTLKSDLTKYRWYGPVNLLGNTALANYTTRTNVVNVSGGLHGSGTLSVGPGWLNLIGPTESTFTGTVSVKGAPTGAIATEHSGIGLHGCPSLLPHAASIAFSDGANLEMDGSDAPQLGALAFSGDVDAAISGGAADIAGLSRPVATGLTKTGTGVLKMDNAVHVAGTADVKEGTLRLPAKVYGHAGLWEGMYVDMSKGLDVVGQGLWNTSGDKVDSKIPEDGWTYSRSGPRKILSGYSNVVSNGITRATCCLYRGYIWNRSDAPVTWQFALHMQYRMIMRLNDEWTPSAWNGHSENGTNVWTTTLNPGSNSVLIYSTSASWNATQAPSKRFDGLGLSYNPNPVEGVTNVADFVRLDDGGTGRLFTIDTEDGPETVADMLPRFDVLKMTADATLDLNANDFVQGNLVGQPTVVNGNLQLTNIWSLVHSDVNTGRALNVSGTLTFGSDAKLAFADGISPTRPATDECVIATADSVVGAPTLDPKSPGAARWRVKTTATEVKLVYVPAGMSIIFR